MEMSINIAIDGPAGAGKSTAAKAVAKRLSFVYIDTGALYRALAVHFLRKGLKTDDCEGIKSSCGDAEVEISFRDGEQHVLLNKEDVTDLLRTEEVGNMASASSAIPAVRAKLLDLQRDLAASSNVVMDGRDIGTRILPHAQVKIFLTASVDTRAERRYTELQKKGAGCSLDEIRADICDRDHRDSTRAASPLKKADDAVLIDSSGMTIEEVTEAVLDVYERCLAENRCGAGDEA